MAEPTYRASMLPIGTYANPDGTESLGWAVPGMIEEPLNALSRLFGTPSNPGTFAQGPDAPGNADAMRTLLLSMYGGNAMNPAAVMPKGSLASNALRTVGKRRLPEIEQVWGPKWDMLMGEQYRQAEAAGDLSTMYDILAGKLSKAADVAPDMREGMVKKLREIHDDMGPDWRKMAGIDDHYLFSDTGKPSIMGSAIAGAERSPDPLTFRRGVDEDFGDPFYAAMKGDQEVGRFGYSELPNAAMVNSAWVEPEFRGQNIASRAYGHIQDDLGKPLTPDIVLTPDGYNFWQSRYPDAVSEHQFDGTNWVAKGGQVPFGSGERGLMDVMRDEGVPDWRLSAGPNRAPGVLFSDGLPSLFGSSLSQPYQDEPRNSLLTY